jgi:hypothetical protein
MRSYYNDYQPKSLTQKKSKNQQLYNNPEGTKCPSPTSSYATSSKQSRHSIEEKYMRTYEPLRNYTNFIESAVEEKPIYYDDPSPFCEKHIMENLSVNAYDTS